MAQIGCYQVIRAGQKPAETAQNQTIVAMFGEEDCVRVGRILGQIGDEDDRAWLVDRLAEPWLRRARRLAERDARIREYALAFHPLLSGRAARGPVADLASQQRQEPLGRQRAQRARWGRCGQRPEETRQIGH
jgi:hypothetical protein